MLVIISMVGLKKDDASIERHHVEHDGEAGANLVRVG